MIGSSGRQMVMDCPFCAARGHLYVAMEFRRRPGKDRDTYPGDFICFKGDERGKLAGLYAQLEGIDYKEAVKLIARDKIGPRLPRAKVEVKSKRGEVPGPAPEEVAAAAVAAQPASIASRIATVRARLRGEMSATRVEEVVDPPPNFPPPSGFRPVWDGTTWRVPRYLTERGITRETARWLGLGYCDHGHYAGRVVIPVVCPYGRSFTARHVDKDVKLRYDSGPGAGRLLFGWDQAQSLIKSGDFTYLVVCEGPFDAMKLLQFGVPAVAILGKRLRESQIKMLRNAGVRMFVLMLDDDALDDAIEQSPMLGAHVMVAKLIPEPGKEKADPGDSTKDVIYAAIESAIPAEMARMDQLAGTIRAVARRASGRAKVTDD